jgi:glycine dehydrogenase
MAGFKVVPIKALGDGSLDLPDLKEKAQKYKDQLAAFMVCDRLVVITYVCLTSPRSPIPRLSVSLRTAFQKHARLFMPTVVRSTLTVFSVCLGFSLCLIIFLGANLNAQVGLTDPAICGGDVCHLNLHKTFAM